MTITLACSVFISRRTPSRYKQTVRKASTDLQKLNELRAVNMTTNLIMMMIVIKMMITADGYKKDNQTTPFLFCLQWIMLAGVANPLTTPYYNKHRFHHHHHHHHGPLHLKLPAKTECQVYHP